jgi:predicted Fe-Mo cluster-binding NifX family protein
MATMDAKASPKRVAIPASSDDLTAAVSDRFARAPYYAIYHHDTLSFTFVTNDAKNEQSGAGTKAARQLGKLDVNAVLVPEIGPKAFETLQAFGIQVYRYTRHYTVRDALYDLYEEKLARIHQCTKDSKHA